MRSAGAWGRVRAMTEQLATFDLVTQYHEAMPARIRQYLVARGIPDSLIVLQQLGWNGKRITIPVFTRLGIPLFFRLAKDPEDRSDTPKVLSPAGASVELYGWERMRAKPPRIVICEGEFDRLVLESHGFAAVTSTGGAGVFPSKWEEDFKEIPEVYVCLDRDDAGLKGAQRVSAVVPHAKIVTLPREVGQGGDITDFFVRLGRNREDFALLLEKAKPVPQVQPKKERSTPTSWTRPSGYDEVHELKARVTLEKLAGEHVSLRPIGQNFIGRCPFHEEETPSFVVYPANQTFYCFGCHTHGDVINFIMRIKSVSFPEALDVLRGLPSAYGQTKG